MKQKKSQKYPYKMQGTPKPRKRVPKGLVRLAGSFLPHEADVPPPQEAAPSSRLLEKVEEKIYPPEPEPPPIPVAFCPHGRPLTDLVDSWRRSRYSYSQPAYFDADGYWVSISPGDDWELGKGRHAVAYACPACCPYCEHQVDKLGKNRRKMIPRDIATGHRVDSRCPLCNPDAIKTPEKWDEFLNLTGLHVAEGSSPHIEFTGGGSKAMEDRDARHTRHEDQKPAKKGRPHGAGTGAGEDDEANHVDDLGMPLGTKYGDHTPMPSAANAAAVEKHREDLMKIHGNNEVVGMVLPCKPQRHKDLMKAAKIKKFEAFLCPYCKLEVYPA